MQKHVPPRIYSRIQRSASASCDESKYFTSSRTKNEPELHQPLLPRFLTDGGHLFDLARVRRVEMQIVPGCAGFPAVKIFHDEEHSHGAVPRNHLFPTRDERVVVFLRQFSTDDDTNEIPFFGNYFVHSIKQIARDGCLGCVQPMRNDSTIHLA